MASWPDEKFHVSMREDWAAGELPTTWGRSHTIHRRCLRHPTAEQLAQWVFSSFLNLTAAQLTEAREEHVHSVPTLSNIYGARDWIHISGGLEATTFPIIPAGRITFLFSVAVFLALQLEQLDERAAVLRLSFSWGRSGDFIIFYRDLSLKTSGLCLCFVEFSTKSFFFSSFFFFFLNDFLRVLTTDKLDALV